MPFHFLKNLSLVCVVLLGTFWKLSHMLCILNQKPKTKFKPLKLKSHIKINQMKLQLFAKYDYHCKTSLHFTSVVILEFTFFFPLITSVTSFSGIFIITSTLIIIWIQKWLKVSPQQLVDNFSRFLMLEIRNVNAKMRHS